MAGGTGQASKQGGRLGDRHCRGQKPKGLGGSGGEEPSPPCAPGQSPAEASPPRGSLRGRAVVLGGGGRMVQSSTSWAFPHPAPELLGSRSSQVHWCVQGTGRGFQLPTSPPSHPLLGPRPRSDVPMWPPHRHPWGLHCLHPAPSKCPGKTPAPGAPEHPCQWDSSPGVPPAPWGDTGTVTVQGEQGGAGPAHHLMKCTRLFPCSTTNPKGVKAKNAAFPDTSWKATAAPQQSAAKPATFTSHRPPPARIGAPQTPQPQPCTEHPPVMLFGAGHRSGAPEPAAPAALRKGRAAPSPRGPTNSQVSNKQGR